MPSLDAAPTRLGSEQWRFISSAASIHWIHWIHAESMLNPCWIHVGFVLNSSLCAAMAPVLIAPCCCRCIRCLGFLFSSQGFRRSDLHVRAQSASIINAIRWDCCYFSHVIAVNGASVSYCWEGFSSDTGHVLLIDLSVLFVILFAVGLIHRGFIVTRSEKCSSLTRRESWSPVRAVVLFTIDYDRSSWLGWRNWMLLSIEDWANKWANLTNLRDKLKLLTAV